MGELKGPKFYNKCPIYLKHCHKVTFCAITLVLVSYKCVNDIKLTKLNQIKDKNKSY